MSNIQQYNAPIADVERMANAIARSGLFGVKRPEEALALMLIAQAEGRHPASAAKDYHIISGKPSLRADSMLSRFQAAGGVIEWHTNTDTEMIATFKHPQACPAGIKIEWSISRAKKAEIYKERDNKGGTGMWIKYPRQMLRARVISEGVRACYPGVLDGMYTPEEVQDMAPIDKGQAVSVDNSVEIPLEIGKEHAMHMKVARELANDPMHNKLINPEYDEYTKAIKACELAINAASAEGKATKPMLDWWDKVNAGQIETTEIIKKTKLLENLTKKV